MFNYSDILNISPFSLDKKTKEQILFKNLFDLTKFHYKNCENYKKILDALNIKFDKMEKTSDLPFIPVRLFKEFTMSSIPQEEVFKTMTSSGTSGQAVSKIVLDKETASNQQKTLVKIVSDFTGTSRFSLCY